ncbi:MAG: HEAT repeat domain-containing protein [Methylotenera sp.]|nr:HEAT repeat domain-containing protein [Oligoflexia bacterium]
MPSRTSDDFAVDDYHLTGGKLFPVTVKEVASLRGGPKDLFNSSYTAILDMHSLGVQGRKLDLIVEFHFEEIKNAETLSHAVKTELGIRKFPASHEENIFLVSLDPSGVVTDIRTSVSALSDTGNQLKINALVPLFKRVPLLKPGKLTRTEGDQRGIPYTILYTVAEAGSNQLKITGLVNDAQKLGTTIKKAAAAGTPNIVLVGLETSQVQSFEWLWNTSLHVPVSQNFKAETSVKQSGSEVSSSQIKVEANWGPRKESRFKGADRSRFAHSIDFKRYLGSSASRLKQFQNLSKKQQLTKSWSRLATSLSGVGNSKMSELEKDELFIALGKAVKEDPSLIGSTKQIALEAEPGSRQATMAIGALGYEGSEEAQSAMIEIYNRPRSNDEEKQKVLTELAICPEALSKETKTFLKAKYAEADPMSSDLASTAGLALGSSIAKDGDPETVKLLKNDWNKSSGFFANKQQQDQQIYLLSAMGNSKSDVFRDQVKSAASSSSPELRAAAVDSVRFAQDETSRALIRSAVKGDSNVDVRITAAQSLRYQPFDETTRQLLVDCSSSSQLAVKMQCYRVLTSRIEQPGVRAILAGRLNSESDDQVKGLLQSALSMKEGDK